MSTTNTVSLDLANGDFDVSYTAPNISTGSSGYFTITVVTNSASTSQNYPSATIFNIINSSSVVDYYLINFINDFVISSANGNTDAQFIINAEYAEVVGNGYNITFNNVTNYNGLITVGTAGLDSLAITGFNAIISTLDTTINNNTGFLYSSQFSVTNFSITNCTYTIVANADIYFTYNSSGVSYVTTPVISYSLTNPNVITTPPTEVTSVPLYGSAPIINISSTNDITLQFTNNFSINDTTQFVVQSNNITVDCGSDNGYNNGTSTSTGSIITFNPVANYTGLITTGSGVSNITIQNINAYLPSGLTNLNNTCGYIYYAQYPVATLIITNCSYTITTNADIYFTYNSSGSISNITTPVISYSSQNPNATTTSSTAVMSAPLYVASSSAANSSITIQTSNNTSDSATVYFTNDFTIANSDFNFIIDSSNITVDGGNNTVTFDKVINYNGLIHSGYNNEFNIQNITIQNIITNADTTSYLTTGAAWIVYSTSCNNMLIQNCVNNCDILGNNNNCSGIVNSYANETFGTVSGVNVLTITNCANTGIVSSANGGGIAGSNLNNNGNMVNISNCYNTGAITAQNAGGIAGNVNSDYGDGTLNIQNCYNIGVISGSNSGGIVGSASVVNPSNNLGNNIINISNCYNAGSIMAASGGIMGTISQSFLDYGNFYYGSVNISNCYNSGVITNTVSGASGICPTTPTTNLTITNTYNAPTVNTTTVEWMDTAADATGSLTGYPISPNPIGSIWTSTGINTPYLLSSFNSSIYPQSVANFTNLPTPYLSPSPKMSNANYKIITVLSQQSNSADQQITYNFTDTASISSSGVITFTPQLIPGISINYTFYVLASNNSSSSSAPTGYQVSTYGINSVNCFNYDTKILVLINNLEEKYVPIQYLRKGDKVKTYLHGYKQIKKIGKSQLLNGSTIKQHCMYKMEKTATNGLIEDLIVTGGHGIMVDELTEYQSNTQELLIFSQTIDNKKLLLPFLSADFQEIQNTNVYTHYNFVLENYGDKNKRYGVYANGLLMETPSENCYDWLVFTPI